MFLKRIHGLPSVMADFIRLSGGLADERGVSAYLVGGFVRDMLLGVDNFDVDIVVDGDGVAFAQELSRKLALNVVVHHRFGTATLSGLEGFKADIASARREVYEKPAALPVVRPGTIKEDAFRRDFTINAMAVGINGGDFGKIFDFYGGREDLKKGLIRALHEASFLDDPTRILRAVRFEQRFGFRMEKRTLLWMEGALRRDMLQATQKHRLRDEMVLLLQEKHPLKYLRRLHDLAGLSFFAPTLKFRAEWCSQFGVLDERIAWFREHFSRHRHLEPHAAYLALLLFSLDVKAARHLLHEFAFHKGESARVLALKEAHPEIVAELRKDDVRPSVVYRLLSPLPCEVLLASMAVAQDDRVVKHIENFLFLYKDKRAHIRGGDLASLGVKPGPRYKKILNSILYAKIDGLVRDREEELALAARLAHGR